MDSRAIDTSLYLLSGACFVGAVICLSLLFLS
jgi:hypothetical protein